MTRTYVVAASIAAMFAATGCGAKFTKSAPEAHAAAEIDRAEDRGAPESALHEAKASYEFAQKMEDNAQADLDRAQDEMKKTEERLATAIANENAKKSEVTQSKGAATAFKTDGTAATKREGELRKSGLKDDEVANASGTDSAMAKHRVASANENVKNAEAELALATRERKYCQEILKQSRFRIDDANERLIMAQRVYRGAAAQADGAEAEALAGKKAVLDMKLQEIGDNADADIKEREEGTPQKAGAPKESDEIDESDESDGQTRSPSSSESVGADRE